MMHLAFCVIVDIHIDDVVQGGLKDSLIIG